MLYGEGKKWFPPSRYGSKRVFCASAHDEFAHQISFTKFLLRTCTGHKSLTCSGPNSPCDYNRDLTGLCPVRALIRIIFSITTGALHVFDLLGP